MKHLKTYKLFENVSNSDLALDVKDMLLELEDSGYQVDISMRPSGVDMFCVEISNDRLFQWSDVKEYLTRVKNYTCENGWELTKIHLGFFNVKLVAYGSIIKIMESMNFAGCNYNYFVQYITEPEFIEKNKIHEISFIFDPIGTYK